MCPVSMVCWVKCCLTLAEQYGCENRQAVGTLHSKEAVSEGTFMVLSCQKKPHMVSKLIEESGEPGN